MADDGGPPTAATTGAELDGKPVGERIRHYREQRGLSASALALRAGLSKSYLSTLELDQRGTRRPSVHTLQRIAVGLGVLLSDLTGSEPSPSPDRSPELVKFASAAGLAESDVEMLSSIQFRGRAPASEERWRYIYNAITSSEALDRDRG